ncbi:P-loop NTPase family protein [Vibrio methylphosphonaticus]|uniref:chromosome partitioning protein ParA n=1 Tax=Vibrio methylphosphonaticus TaxID=2946866 RepID=UPI00202A8597|nr:chromosome partitioning protein ParA [Vibrio methylphosphonaticus]MCL9774411.1 chromosome partitioning protein ParA [Vibrio methylphosphonaticus]
MTIPATHSEIEEIYLNAELHQCRSLCISACNEKEGTTSIAQALTERYLLAGYKTLLVDLNMHHPSLTPISMGETDQTVQTGEKHGNSNGLVQHNASPRVFLGIAAPSDPATRLSYKDPRLLQQEVTHWLEEYDRVIVDTSPILNVNKNNIPAPCVANACDGTILVVLSGVAAVNQVEDAIARLSQGAHTRILGTILNYQHQPSLASEICREIDRFSWLPKGFTARLKRSVANNRFLSSPI